MGATAIQGVTSFTLTQLLSKAAQRMIADLRKQVQAHIGRLSISFHDTNKTGNLVARIMSDVEGLRNLMGTGLVEFVGSLMTASFALIVLLRISVFMTAVAFAILLAFGLALNKAIGTIRPIFRARSKLNAEVTGRLTESLGGIRVVKGYHAEGREEDVFAGGVQRLLENILKTLTATSVMSLSSTVLFGLVSALIIYLGTHAHPGRNHDAGHFPHLRRVSGHAGCAGVADREHRDAAYRRNGRPRAHHRHSGGKSRGPGSAAHRLHRED